MSQSLAGMLMVLSWTGRSKPKQRVARTAGAMPASALANLPCAFVLVLGLTGTTIASAGPMYKWTDEKGQVVYSDQPPPSSIQSEIVKPPPPPANPNAV